jgi:hypothetical protein
VLERHVLRGREGVRFRGGGGGGGSGGGVVREGAPSGGAEVGGAPRGISPGSSGGSCLRR